MNKEEILEKSRNDNKNNDPYYLETRARGMKYGRIAAIILCLALFAIDYIILGKMNYGYYGIFTALFAADYLYRWKKTDNKDDFYAGALMALATVVSVVSHFVHI